MFVDADTLHPATGQTPDPSTPTEPATLAGHGAIGPNLLSYFLCVSDFTAFLIKTGGQHQAEILNAARSRYQPTPCNAAPSSPAN